MNRRASVVAFVFVSASVAGLLVGAACGDEHAIVRDRLPGSSSEAGVGDASADADAGPACTVTFPSTYDSPTFETNAAVELGLRKDFDDFLAPMANVETELAADAGAPTPVTKAQLAALYAAGDPSVKAASTTYYQGKIDAYLTAYETALTDGTYTPETPDGGDKGGTYGGFVFDPTGLDLRQAIESGTYGAAFYNQAVGLIAAGSPTVGTIDRLVAAYGANPSFPNNADAPQNKDVNSAALAARRDAKDPANPGPYQRIRSALIKAQATVTGGAGCAGERDATLKIFLSEWEKSNYATVVFDLSDVITRLSTTPTPTTFAPALHSFGHAVGLIAGFKGVAQDHRIITDAQIDSLLQKIGAPDGAPSTAYNLALSPVAAASNLQQAITIVQSIYTFSDADIDGFKKDN